MTWEQNEEWQRAITLEDYQDSHAASPEGLQESLERLIGAGVPNWAAQLRFYIMLWRWKDGPKPWHRPFLLRSEVALVGILMRYPVDYDEAFQRVFVRFLTEALRPFVAYAQESPDFRQAGSYSYSPLIALYEGCAKHTPPQSRQERIEQLQEWKALKESQFYLPGYSEGGSEAYWAYRLGKGALGYLRDILDDPEVPDSGDYNIAWNLVINLNRQHQWRLEGEVDRVHAFTKDNNYTELIAKAYLTTLEGECPPPDRLPQA